MCFGAEKRFNLGQVVDQLKPVTGWSRNTVHTYLTRMESKGLVTIDRSKDPHQYKAGVSHEECARKRTPQSIGKDIWRSDRGSGNGFFKGVQDNGRGAGALKKLLDEMEV